ncbi:hypothetical protein [Actinoplanes sp. L3-i22]|uniref:hypothetical protein n=1 Tax=Actinoplanes sp. L3-i22 TaxID=2836373 RepID=UPI001C73FB9C|nr:hypothetical protein [Actinoplanes sp. L3-i22]BCY09035.1 hypothetical protein L3i22_041230 [Actinoplanes sp. L3-i22]
MRHLKRLAAAALPAALALSAPVPADAAPAIYTLAQIQAKFGLAAAAFPTLPSYVTNTIYNQPSSQAAGMGVFVPNSSQTYDQVLPVGYYSYQRFGWNTTGGWYTGSGWCTWQLRSDDRGKNWSYQKPDLGPGRHAIGRTTSYIIASYRQFDGKCSDT